MKSFHPIHWGSKSARAQPAQEQRTAKRSHAWGISLFPIAGNIPYSNKAFKATVPSSGDTAQAASKMVDATVSNRDLAAQADGPESSTQPNSLPANPAPMPSAAPCPSNGFANTGNAAQPTSFEFGHHKSGAGRLQLSTGSFPLHGCASHLNQGFWQELQQVLRQLPDHRVAACQSLAAGTQLQEAIAAAAHVQIPLTKCHALACLATASSYRGSHNVMAQQAAQQAAQQTVQQAARLAAQLSAQQPAQQLPQEPAHPALQDACQHSLDGESALPEQAHAHVSMHAMLAHARKVPNSHAGKLAPDTVPTSGINSQDVSSSSAAELDPDGDTAVHPRLEVPLLATGPPPAQGGGTQITAAQSLQAQQQEEHRGNHTAVLSQSWAGSLGTLQQATASTHDESIMPLQTNVTVSEPNAALTQSEQAARGTVVAAATPAVADPGQTSTAGPAISVEEGAKSPGITPPPSKSSECPCMLCNTRELARVKADQPLAIHFLLLLIIALCCKQQAYAQRILGEFC